jgi:hypothetical protein
VLGGDTGDPGGTGVHIELPVGRAWPAGQGRPRSRPRPGTFVPGVLPPGRVGSVAPVLGGAGFSAPGPPGVAGLLGETGVPG